MFDLAGRLLAAALLCVSCATANAYLIGLQPGSTAPTFGSSFTLDLVVTGLPPQIVSTYDIDFNFNPAIVQYVSSASTGVLGASIFLGTPSAGSANLFESSFESDSTLASLQGSTLTLATLTFRGIGVGSTPIELAFHALGGAQDENGLTTDLLQIDHTVTSATARVTPSSAAPEPGTLALLGLGLLCTALRPRRPPPGLTRQ